MQIINEYRIEKEEENKDISNNIFVAKKYFWKKNTQNNFFLIFFNCKVKSKELKYTGKCMCLLREVLD